MCWLLTHASLHNTHTQRKLVCWFASDCLLVWRAIDGIPRAYSTICICKCARNWLRKHHLLVVSAANQRIQTYCKLIGSSKDINTYMILFSTYLYTMFVKLDKAVSKVHAITILHNQGCNLCSSFSSSLIHRIYPEFGEFPIRKFT